jgi:hypothetical protein
MSAFLLGAAVGVLVNLFTALFSRKHALRLIPWVSLYVALHLTAVILNSSTVRLHAMNIAKHSSQWISYPIVGIVALTLALIFWWGINSAVAKLDHATSVPTSDQLPPIQEPNPAKSPIPKEPAAWIRSDGHNQHVEITDNKFSAERPAIDLGPDSGELIISRNVFGTPTTSPEDQRLVNGLIADYVKLYPKEGERIVKGESPSPLEAWVNGKLRDKGVHWTVRMKQLEGDRKGLKIISVVDPPN